MLDTLKKLETILLVEDKKFLERRIEILDKKINSLVYSLYELSEDDIEIIESEK